MIEILKVGCPECGSVLKVKRVPDIQNKVYTCKVCGKKSKVSQSKWLGFEQVLDLEEKKDLQPQNNVQSPVQSHSHNPVQSHSHNPVQSTSSDSGYASPGEVVKIKCLCGKVIAFYYRQGYENKKVTCPICGLKSVVCDLPRVATKPKITAETPTSQNHNPQIPTYQTYSANSQNNNSNHYSQEEDPTRVHTDEDVTTMGIFPSKLGPSSKQNLAILRVKGTNRTYQLSQGKNVIGKKATTSTADIKIETETRRLSREHLVIEALNNGEDKAYYVSLYKERVNETFVGKTKMEFGDKIRLENGTEIGLPDIIVVFEIPDNDATQLY